MQPTVDGLACASKHNLSQGCCLVKGFICMQIHKSNLASSGISRREKDDPTARDTAPTCESVRASSPHRPVPLCRPHHGPCCDHAGRPFCHESMAAGERVFWTAFDSNNCPWLPITASMGIPCTPSLPRACSRTGASHGTADQGMCERYSENDFASRSQLMNTTSKGLPARFISL